jgi:predicted nucleic acid-binding protein
MIIFDTNVLSVLMRMPVVAWLDRQPAESIWITRITLFAAHFGLALLPTARQRPKRHCTGGAGRKMGGSQWFCGTTQIANITIARHATLATRNVLHFGDLKIVNPWTAQPT